MQTAKTAENLGSRVNVASLTSSLKCCHAYQSGLYSDRHADIHQPSIMTEFNAVPGMRRPNAATSKPNKGGT
jgi:hypothetical protein